MRTSKDVREGPGTSIHAIILRVLIRVVAPLLILGGVLLGLGIKTSHSALTVGGSIVLGLSALLLVPALLFVASTIVLPALKASGERREMGRAIAALDAAEAGPDDAAFQAACVRVREGFGASPLDQRLLDPGRSSRARYLIHATTGALESLARKTEDPVAPLAWLEVVRRRDAAAAVLAPDRAQRAWRAAIATSEPFEVPREFR